MAQETDTTGSAARGGDRALPNVGEILRRLRVRRGLSLRDVALATDLSASFLSEVERGTSDIALARLARLAEFHGHDVGSLLGYTARRATPEFVREGERLKIDRGTGVAYEVLRIPGMSLELIDMTFAPQSAFDEELTHEGVDVMLVIEGRLILRLNGVDHSVTAGECAIWSASYRHGVRNEADEPARALGVVTESVY